MLDRENKVYDGDMWLVMSVGKNAKILGLAIEDLPCHILLTLLHIPHTLSGRHTQ